MTQYSVFVHSPPLEGPKTARGKRTWLKLLEAAVLEFGERGYHEAALERITVNAGVARGTFYVHFESKEAIFRAVVSHISHTVRRSVAESVSAAENRFDAERKGLEEFIRFVRDHPEIYRIVHEAQFVAPDAYRAYYSGFAAAYQRRLAEAARAGQIKPGADEERAWALIGASVFLGLRYGIWDDVRDPAEIAQGVADLIENGLAPG
jgi:AcrR family transcriptional regulator